MPPDQRDAHTSGNRRSGIAEKWSVVMSTTTRPRLTGRNKVGLVIAGVLGLADASGPSPAGVATLFFVPQYSTQGVELLVLVGFIVAVLLGLATVVGVILTWVTGKRIIARVVAAARVVSLLMTALIFLVNGEGTIAPWVYVIAAAVVILDIVAVILVLSHPAAPAPA
jgi:hypothetical protein